MTNILVLGYLLPGQILFRPQRINNISRVKQFSNFHSKTVMQRSGDHVQIRSDPMKKSAKPVKQPVKSEDS
jgi:hypothetical protein